MVKAVFDELKKPEPKNSFTVGINDDVSHTSLDIDPNYSIEPDDVVRAVFYGLGADAYGEALTYFPAQAACAIGPERSNLLFTSRNAKDNLHLA
jgi:hypothetical protein